MRKYGQSLEVIDMAHNKYWMIKVSLSDPWNNL